MSLFDSIIEDALPVSELKQPLDTNPSVDGLRELFFAVRTDGATGDGTRQNPFCISRERRDTMTRSFLCQQFILSEETTVFAGSV